MSGATYLGLILLVGGALLDGLSLNYRNEEEDSSVEDVLLFRAFVARRGFTRTGRLLQALGTVLFIIGVLALLL